ncbi:hypothetical protein LIA77_11519 [Sarocladium implicatum]|nr:hypothetical protein LIA77_11519 [Sarocladium implicatum]
MPMTIQQFALMTVDSDIIRLRNYSLTLVVGINSSAKIVFSDEMESGKYYFQIQETASGQRATSETFRYDSDSESADTKDADVEQNDTKEGPKDDEVKEGKTKDDGTEEDDDSGSTSAKSATRAVAASATGLSALLALGLVFL